MDLIYNDLVEALKRGHEFEFIWKNHQFSICCQYPDKWFFCLPEMEVVVEFGSVDELLQKIEFSGLNFRHILPTIKESVLF